MILGMGQPSIFVLSSWTRRHAVYFGREKLFEMGFNWVIFRVLFLEGMLRFMGLLILLLIDS
jgi:hypothetical protein